MIRGTYMNENTSGESIFESQKSDFSFKFQQDLENSKKGLKN